MQHKSVGFLQSILAFIVCATVMEPSGVNGAGFDPDFEAAVDGTMTQWYLPANNVPGAGIAIVSTSGESFVKGYGYRDVENAVEADENTLYALGSISKSITATLTVKILHEEFPLMEERVLDAPIVELAPNFTNFMMSDRFRTEHTSFRDLLSHRTCVMPDYMTSMYKSYNSKEEAIYRLRYANEICSVRTDIVYNNFLLSMAAEVLASIRDTTVENLFDEFFDELKMMSTTYVKETDDHNNMENRSKPYYDLPDRTTWLPFNPELLKRAVDAIGAGGILSTPKDMMRFMLLHLNGGELDGVPIVPKRVMQWVYKPSQGFPVHPYEFQEGLKITYSYGLSFAIANYKGHYMVEHGGNLPPYESTVTMYLNDGIGIFTVGNGPGETLQAQALLHLVISNFLWHGPELNQSIAYDYDIAKPGLNWDVKTSPLMFQNSPYSIDMQKYLKEDASNAVLEEDDIIGLYGHALYATFDIVYKDNVEGVPTLYWRAGEWGKGYLRKLFGNYYSLLWDSDIVHEFWSSGSKSEEDFQANFLFGEEGVIVGDGLVGYQFLKNLTLDKLPPQPWDPNSC